MAENVVRVITIKGQAEGLDGLSAKLRDVASAQGQVAQSSAAVGVATETTSRKQLSAVSAFDRVQKSLDETYRSQSAYARVSKDLDRASAQGLVSETRRAELLDLASQKYSGATKANDNFARSVDATTKSTGLARHELINLSRQAQDVATMFALGAPPMQIFASQAAQIGDIFASTSGSIGGFLKQVGGGIARFAMSGTGLAAGGLAVTAGAVVSAMSYASAQRDIAIALDGVGRSSGATIDGINRLATSQAAAAKVSIASAREIASAFAATGRTDPTALPGLLPFAKNFATSQGMDTGEAAKELAGIFADPTKGAETLQGKIGGLSEASRKWIADLQASGDRLGASKALLDTFSQSVAGASERTGYFAQTWQNVRAAISNADDALGKFASGMQTPLDKLEELTKRRAGISERSMAGNGFARQQAADLDAQIRQTQGLVELDRQRNDLITKRAKADNASLAAGRIVDEIDATEKSTRALKEQASALSLAMSLNPRAAEYDAWSKSLDKVNSAMATLLPLGEREKRTHELNVAAINARTLAERTAVEVAREALRLSGEKVSAGERELAMQRKAAEMAAQANRDAQDALRTSRDQLAVAGKTPGDRARIEADQRYRDNLERFGGSASTSTGATALPATAAAVTGMDAVFAASLKQLMADIPGISISSGFRSTKRQAELWSDALEKYGSAEEARKWVAPPGGSQHEKGLAADLRFATPDARAQAHANAGKYGLTFPLSNENWHIEPIGGRAQRGAGAVTNGNSAADEIRRNELSARDLNTIDSVLGNSNRELERQKELLDLSKDSWNRSAAEIAKAAKEQELMNALQREGIAVTPELRAQIASTADGYGKLAQATAAAAEVQKAYSELNGAAKDFTKGIFSDIRSGKSGLEALQNQLNKLADKLFDMAVNDLWGKAIGGGGSGSGLTSFLGSLFKFGGGSSTAAASSGAYSAGAGGYAGFGPFFDKGGFTGPGGKMDPAGIVHRGEYVFDASATSRIGVNVLEAMRRGVPGYADGGYVGTANPMPAAANDSRVANWNVNVVNANPNAQVRTEQKEDGSLDIYVDQIEGQIARKVARRRGPLSLATRSTTDGTYLRG